MKFSLLPRDPLALHARIDLTTFPTVLGRGDDASVKIDDRWLSRVHCELRCEDGALVVRDLGSKHGTFINGRRIDEFTLTPGDVLGIGLCRFVAAYEAAATPSHETAFA